MDNKLTSGILMPMHGRDYNERADIITDLNADKGFIHQTAKQGYCSIHDLADGQFQVRSADGRKLWTVNIKNGIAK